MQLKDVKYTLQAMDREHLTDQEREAIDACIALIEYLFDFIDRIRRKTS